MSIAPTQPQTLRSRGHLLDTSPAAFGELRPTDPAAAAADLRQRLADDGYLYLPGALDRELVLTARRDVLKRLAHIGVVAGDDPEHAIPGPQASRQVRDEVARVSEPLQQVLYGGQMIALYEQLFGGDVRHFDFTWLRAIPPGLGTPPHGDSVFMNRGTSRLLTAWTPLGDIDYELGGLILLAGSHRLADIRHDYGSRDVDTYCSNDADADAYASGEKRWNGSISDNPAELRQRLGLRWLTARFHAGDLLTFSLYTLHASLDNTSAAIRLSSDSRYQPATEPADPRWVGPHPSAHGAKSKHGVIC